MIDKLEKFNEKHVGGEPSYALISHLEQQENHDMIVMKALNWYSANRELSDSNKYFVAYCEKNKLPIRNDIPNDVVGNVGFLCRMIHRGLIPTPKITDRIDKRYQELKDWAPSRIQRQAKAVTKEKKPHVVEHSDVFLQILSDIDQQLDLVNRGDEVSKKINIAGATSKDLKLLLTYLKSVKKEYEGTDSLDNEYRACYPGKRIINRIISFIDDTISKIESYNKALKISTSSKPQPASKQVAGMKCLKEWKEYKSLPLEKLVGAKAILLFNTKYRKIMYLEAKSSFTCKGAAFYDVEKWVCKTSRKPESQLKDWMVMTKPQLKAALEAVSGTNSTPQVRIGKDTLFLRAF